MRTFQPVVSLLLFILMAPVGFSQTNRVVAVTWDVRKDVDALVPSGESVVTVLDVSSESHRQEILQKAMLALQERPDILKELYEVHDLGIDGTRRADLFRELGYTPQEYDELERVLNSTEAPAAVAAGTENVAVVRTGDRISFRAGERLSFLNDLVIDPINNVVMIGKNVLSTRDTITVSTAANPFGSPWQGYQWSYTHGMPELRSVAELCSRVMAENVDGETYTVTLGYLDNQRRSFLQVAATEIRAGRFVRSYNVPLVFLR